MRIERGEIAVVSMRLSENGKDWYPYCGWFSAVGQDTPRTDMEDRLKRALAYAEREKERLDRKDVKVVFRCRNHRVKETFLTIPLLNFGHLLEILHSEWVMHPPGIDVEAIKRHIRVVEDVALAAQTNITGALDEIRELLEGGDG